MAMSKLKVGLGVALVAGAAALIFFPSQTQQQLRAENESLRQQIAQLKSANQDTPTRNSNTSGNEDLNELLRLRGEVTTLRSLTNELHEQNVQLNRTLEQATQKSHPAANTNIPLGRAYFDLQYRTAELALKGMFSCAADHGGNLPATFDQAASYYASHALATNLSKFVITYQGSLTNIANPADAIVVQSLQPFIDKETNAVGLTIDWLTKIYGFADGHVTGHGAVVDSYLDDWELKHLPVLKNQ
jgi:gas vesicle protein